MRLLKRGSNDTPTVVPEAVPVSLGKGRPTPKRRDAEARKRGPVPPPPTTQRQAYKRSKATGGTKLDRKAASADRRERMMAGDDAHVLPRDRGPARALARDVVDSRRNLIGLFMPLALVVVILYFLAPATSNAVSLGMLAAIVVMVVEGVFLARLVSGRVHERFPDEPAGAVKLGWYSFVRASQLRRLRAPRPRVQPGDAV
ncbi:DUF3043 domain-containing protein [Rhodococcus antarcticus]|uniref:DUF3043 domain-containing protein n=1 Tax=Rhodococcus antarcticus TaxID=2987751 RepID=UPI003F49721A